MKARAVGKGQTDIKRFQTAANEPSIEMVFIPKPCAICGKLTHGWGMVTDIHVSGPERFKRVCSKSCNEKFYAVMSAAIVWVKGFIPYAPKK